MKIVHVCPTYFSPDSTLGGAERYSFELAKAMSKMAEVTLITFGKERFFTQKGALAIQCHKKLFDIKGNTANPFCLSYLSQFRNADVIHCHQINTMVSDLAILAGLVLRKKVFITDLGGSADFALSYHLPLRKGIASLLLISNYNLSFFSDNAVPAKVILGGVDVQAFQPRVSEKSDERILFVGRFIPFKGIHVLIDALGERGQLDIVGQVGDRAYFAKLKEQAKGKKVTFHINLPDEELVRFYQRATITVIPALFEGGYTTALESMACATPVIATRVGSLPELVDDGATGFLVPANNPEALREKINLFLADPQLARQMGQTGRQAALERFSWEKVAQEFIKAYGCAGH